MFGYITILKSELKVKDYYRYKAYYCGLCNTLGKKYGKLGQMTLTYDFCFLIILLTSLYESKPKKESHRCMVHPLKKHDMLINEISEYAADMNLALTYHHLLDDWQDEKSMLGLTGSKLILSKYKNISEKYPRQCEVIKKTLKDLHDFEEKQITDIDAVSGCFGTLMAELFVYQQDIWEPTLRSFGYYLGKFIYLIDAYEDLDKDIKKGNYNPLKAIKNASDYEMKCENMLTLMLADAARYFELLPCVVEADILRNILYTGVWTKYDKLRKEKEQIV